MGLSQREKFLVVIAVAVLLPLILAHLLTVPKYGVEEADRLSDRATYALVPVIALGESTDSLVLCEITGEVVGLLGLEVIASGFLDASSSGLTESQPPAEMLDVAALVATLRTKLRGRFAPPLPDGKRL